MLSQINGSFQLPDHCACDLVSVPMYEDAFYYTNMQRVLLEIKGEDSDI